MLVITLTIALFYLSFPVNHDSAAKLTLAIIPFNYLTLGVAVAQGVEQLIHNWKFLCIQSGLGIPRPPPVPALLDQIFGVFSLSPAVTMSGLRNVLITKGSCSFLAKFTFFSHPCAFWQVLLQAFEKADGFLPVR